MRRSAVTVPIAVALACTLFVAYGHDRSSLDGRWKLVREKSASIDPWTDLVLEIQTEASRLTLVKRYSAGHPHDRQVDSMTVNTEGREEIVPAPQGRWLGEVSMGVYYGMNSARHVVARMNDAGNVLQIETHETLETGQGTTDIDSKESFTLLSDGSTMQWTVSRSTRKASPRLTFTLERMKR